MEGSIKSQKMETLKSSTSTLKLFKHNTCANVLHFITGKKKNKKKWLCKCKYFSCRIKEKQVKIREDHVFIEEIK